MPLKFKFKSREEIPADLTATRLMNGRWTPLKEIDQRLSQKVSIMITHVGAAALQSLGATRQQFRQRVCQSLQNARDYVLDPDKKFIPKPQRS